ncbi:MAG: PIG-L deacetylase family protein, partial [Anaerolineales bacterium]
CVNIDTIQLKPAASTRRMLVCFAHPDDESFGPGGTLAHYARVGVDVHLICATRGEVGTIDPEHLETHGSAAAVRSAELECAARTLGLTAVHYLGYRDSGMPGSPDNAHPEALAAAPAVEVAARVTHIMQLVQPQIVITFDPIGGYYHPDHIAMHKATLTAYEQLAQQSDSTNGRAPFRPQKLYYSTYSRRWMRQWLRVMRLFGDNTRAYGRNGDIDLEKLAQVDFPLHAFINVREVAHIKQAAAACHRSQQSLASTWRTRMLFRRRAGKFETFMRARPPAPKRYREHDLFEGVV